MPADVLLVPSGACPSIVPKMSPGRQLFRKKRHLPVLSSTEALRRCIVRVWHFRPWGPIGPPQDPKLSILCAPCRHTTLPFTAPPPKPQEWKLDLHLEEAPYPWPLALSSLGHRGPESHPQCPMSSWGGGIAVLDSGFSQSRAGPAVGRHDVIAFGP